MLGSYQILNEQTNCSPLIQRTQQAKVFIFDRVCLYFSPGKSCVITCFRLTPALFRVWFSACCSIHSTMSGTTRIDDGSKTKLIHEPTKSKASPVISTRAVVAILVIVLYASVLTAIYANFPGMKKWVVWLVFNASFLEKRRSTSSILVRLKTPKISETCFHATTINTFTPFWPELLPYTWCFNRLPSLDRYFWRFCPVTYSHSRLHWFWSARLVNSYNVSKPLLFISVFSVWCCHVLLLVLHFGP